VVAAAALVGLVGYATAGLAASRTSVKTTPLTSDQLTQIQGQLQTAVTLEQRAIADLKKGLKKGTPGVERDVLVSLRRAKTDLSAAAGVLVASGFRTSPPFNPISNASNQVGIALSYQPSKGLPSKYRSAATQALLKNAISLEQKALALLPPLAVATSTATTTTAPTTTG
jgi:hypothetical protein